MPPETPLRPPARGTRLKRRLLAGAVDDNLRAIQNRPPGRLYRKAPVSWTLIGALVALACAGAALWLSLGRVERAVAATPPPVARLSVARPTGDSTANPVLARIPASVFPVAVHRIMLDPGHGGGDEGTHTSSGLLEKDLTLDIAKRLQKLLTKQGYDAELTRSDDRRVSLRERARLANELRADLFVSIHVNWFQDGRSNRGIETYYLGPSDDPFITELASAENQESGYSVADVRRLLDSIYADLRQEQSRALAADVQRQLVHSIREVSKEVRDRGVKSAPFLVLVSAEMPAILAEVASLSNADEAHLLTEVEYRQRIAVALSAGIRSYSEVAARSATPMEAR